MAGLDRAHTFLFNRRVITPAAGLAELVDALDSKSSSSECGFESHSRYPKSNRTLRLLLLFQGFTHIVLASVVKYGLQLSLQLGLQLDQVCIKDHYH